MDQYAVNEWKLYLAMMSGVMEQIRYMVDTVTF